MQVQLFKRLGTYVDKKDNKEKRFTNFYLKCGDALIPIEPCFFPRPEFDGRDPQYSGRKEVLTAFAAILPDKSNKGGSEQNQQPAPPPPDGVTPASDTEEALSGF